MNLPSIGLHQFSQNKHDLYPKLKISRLWHDGKLQVCSGSSSLEAIILDELLRQKCDYRFLGIYQIWDLHMNITFYLGTVMPKSEKYWEGQ